jgi:hypothetical protein
LPALKPACKWRGEIPKIARQNTVQSGARKPKAAKHTWIGKKRTARGIFIRHGFGWPQWTQQVRYLDKLVDALAKGLKASGKDFKSDKPGEAHFHYSNRD